MGVLDLFGFLYDKPTFEKPIHLIELFGGYGSQHLSLNYLNIPFAKQTLCEWAVKSIQAYKDIHCENDNTNYSLDLTKEEIADYLYQKGISQDYNKPMSLEQIKRLNESQLRTIYNNIIATHNLVNIQQVHYEDLGVSAEYTNIASYSFPCQDLSLAGLRKGLAKGSETRSGMLWEVERILLERKETESPIDVLLMENVPQVLTDRESWNSWCLSLERMGYTNYYETLNAKDYGIPQNRKRTFMISIYGGAYYEFPNKIKLEKVLKDLLEENVDEKYYLSEKMINGMLTTQFNQYSYEKIVQDKEGVCDTSVSLYDHAPLGVVVKDEIPLKRGYSIEINQENETTTNEVDMLGSYSKSDFSQTSVVGKNGIAPAVTENHGQVTAIPEIKLVGGVGEKKSNGGTQYYLQDRVYDSNGIATTTTTHEQFQPYYVIKQINKALEKDSNAEFVDIYNGNAIDKVSTTITTSTGQLGGCGSVGIIEKNSLRIKNATELGYLEAEDGDGIDISSRMETHRGTVQKGLAQKLKTQQDVGVVTPNLRIRKLTPKECFRLMGVKEADYLKVSKNQSNSSLYHLAGDSIVTSVLMAIFGMLFGIEYENKIRELVESYK